MLFRRGKRTDQDQPENAVICGCDSCGFFFLITNNDEAIAEACESHYLLCAGDFVRDWRLASQIAVPPDHIPLLPITIDADSVGFALARLIEGHPKLGPLFQLLLEEDRSEVEP